MEKARKKYEGRNMWMKLSRRELISGRWMNGPEKMDSKVSV